MIKSILKGIIIGITNIVPGVSGGTLMVSMGIFDKLIHCITHLFSEFKQSVKFLFPIVLGMLIAIVAGAFALKAMFEKIPIQANLLFVGLILGGFPAIWKKVKGNTIKAGHLLAAIAFFALVAGMAALGEPKGMDADLSFSVANVLILFAVGVIASATMVIPGVSGSMILKLMGFYEPVVTVAIPGFVAALAHFDMNGILKGCGTLIPFGLGIVAGVFGIAKLVEIIFQKFPLYAYWAIIGLIVASPVAIVWMERTAFAGMNPLSAVTGVIALAAGLIMALKLGD